MSSQKKSKKQVKTGPKRARVQGGGSYLGDWWQANRKYLPRGVGAVLGSLAGDPTAGWNMGGKISKDVLGWGAYRAGLMGSGSYGQPWTVTSNSLTSEGNIPAVVSTMDRGIQLVHSEYLGNVVSSTTFVNSTYAINPGMSSTFPWLSKIAVNFQQYRLKGMLVVFKSQMTDAVATFSALGSVAIAVNLNAADRPCGNQTEIEQLKFCAVGKPSMDIVAPVECARSQSANNVNFVRNSAIPTGSSIIDYDHGTIQVGVNACPSGGVVLGRLYVSYDVELLNPRMVMQGSGSAAYRCTGLTTANYFGDLASMVKVTDTIGLKFTAPNSIITFPTGTYGTYMIVYQVKSDSATLTNAPSYTYSNCARTTTFKPFYAGGTTYLAYTNWFPGVTATDYHAIDIIEITDPSKTATWAISGGTLGANAYGCIAVSALPLIPGLAPLGGAPALTDVPEEKSVEDTYESVGTPLTTCMPVAPAGAAAGAAAVVTKSRSAFRQ